MGEGGGRERKWNEDWRTLTGFWLLGMCNNFGYVVMLSAAHDLLSNGPHEHEMTPFRSAPTPVRECNYISTGAILLADIVPSVIIKLLSPFFPLWIHVRVLLTVLLGAGGFILVAINSSQWLMVLGVILTSLASGMGESSFLMYMPFFKNKNVISTWSSGTGGAGVLGSLSYLGLIAAGLDPSTTIYIMLVVPVIMAISFWGLLDRPQIEKHPEEGVIDDHPIAEDETSVTDKLKLIYKITIVYMMPFALVYVFEYFINQGLFELINFDNTFIDHATQYRWYSFDYQIGVLISRSTVNVLKVDNTWMLAFLQGINVVFMTTEAIYRWVGQFWLVIVFIFWEGLLGGCSYVNTYRRINKEMPPNHRQFSMSMNSFGDAIGITLAGIIAIPAGGEGEVRHTRPWRLIVGFWLLGLCNNFGYVVMLSAAHDLLTPANQTTHEDSNPRHCNKMSTGAILLADIIPAVIIKLILPFFPLWIHFRLICVIVLSILGFVFVALKLSFWFMITGVVLTSFASGMGESSLLAYMPAFNYPNVISSWSSGTGGAGVLGSLSYLAFTSAGVDPSTTIFSMNAVPLLMGIAFWIILSHPQTRANNSTNIPIESTYVGLRGRLKLIYKIVIVYMIPFSLVYVFEYFINQGLSELVIFKGIWPKESSQYRWYSFIYQVGVMISRSSVNIVEINNTWMLAILQGINVAFMTTEAIYIWLNSFWVVCIFILWEGLLGGCSYVNTYRRINVEMPEEHKQFSMSMNSFGDSIGITISGFLAIPVHNAICNMPPP